MNSATALYGGLDLHGDNVFCSLLDERRSVVFEKRFPNDLSIIQAGLEPFRKRIVQLAVESTYNWYWLVDGLKGLAYDARLANPARMQENIGLKMASDKTDARFIARQLVNGILPEGYIYPVETRGVRDMLRRRLRLVQDRTSEWLGLEALVARHTGRSMSMRELQGCEIGQVLAGQPHALIMAEANLRHIEFLEKGGVRDRLFEGASRCVNRTGGRWVGVGQAQHLPLLAGSRETGGGHVSQGGGPRTRSPTGPARPTALSLWCPYAG